MQGLHHQREIVRLALADAILTVRFAAFLQEGAYGIRACRFGQHCKLRKRIFAVNAHQYGLFRVELGVWLRGAVCLIDFLNLQKPRRIRQ